MKIQLKYVFMSLLLGMSSASFAGWFGPDNYDECILKNIKDAKNDMAAKYVAHSCREKFPENSSVKQDPSKVINANKLCILYSDGRNTTILNKHPENWRDTLKGYNVSSIYNIHFAVVYLPKAFKAGKEAEVEQFIWTIANNYCK